MMIATTNDERLASSVEMIAENHNLRRTVNKQAEMYNTKISEQAREREVIVNA